ncbi:MAG: sterol desaturase family protein [Bacteroidota bacterium]|nr:sterol desaturase family protein [Bacteroidota bacterium]
MLNSLLQTKESILLLISTPIYLVLILLEIGFSVYHHKNLYKIKDTILNIYLSSLNFTLDILLRVYGLFILNYFFQFKFIEIKNEYVYWFVLLVTQDFMYYWEHRADHFIRLFWAVHVTHHSSQYFNLTTGFRSSVLQPLYRFVYFIPLALIGFSAVDIMLMYAITQIYGILIHTKTIHKLGFLEYFMATPSHHRVHHASNTIYLDKNLGMVFIIWDKLFKTFKQEDETLPIKYGLTKNIETPYHPIKIITHEWKSLFEDIKNETSWKNKFLILIKPPGWKP